MTDGDICRVQDWLLTQLVLLPSPEDRQILIMLLKMTAQRPSAVPQVEKLTPGERRVVAAALAHPGLSNAELAAVLNVSAHTVRNVLFSVYQKIGVHRRTELASLPINQPCSCGECHEQA